MPGLVFSSSLSSTTVMANAFVVVSGVETNVVVQLRNQIAVPTPTITLSKRIAPTFSEGIKERIKVSSSATVSQWRRVARLARIAVFDEEIFELCSQLNSIMSFVTQLEEVDVAGVEPMTSVTPMALKMREDKVTDGGIADDILANAPEREDHFFLVPKVVE
jgi:aspartyl-tRNA(Asn)/glutamyl-tRNA(Gln) amidotransferase subunit C